MNEKDVVRETRPRMEGAVDDFRRKMATIRTGRAATSILDTVMVDYYGTPTPLNQMASVHAPEPQMLTVQPWDQTQIGAVEKAIRGADLGLNPSNDGKLVRVPIPPLTEERRKQLAKGIEWTVVNGQVLMEKGEHTGAYPGKVARSSSPAQQ